MKTILTVILFVNGVFLYAFIGFGLYILWSKIFGFDWKKEWNDDPYIVLLLMFLWPVLLWGGLTVLPFYLIYVVVNKIVEGMR